MEISAALRTGVSATLTAGTNSRPHMWRSIGKFAQISYIYLKKNLVTAATCDGVRNTISGDSMNKFFQ
jgi:hypothetical protein